MRKMKTYSEREIRRMPYDKRLRMYEEEKDELFRRSVNMSAADISVAHAELARKWNV